MVVNLSNLFIDSIPEFKEARLRYEKECILKILKYASLHPEKYTIIDSLFLEKNNIRISVHSLFWTLKSNKLVHVKFDFKDSLRIVFSQEGVELIKCHSINASIIIPTHREKFIRFIKVFRTKYLSPIWDFILKVSNIMKNITESGIIKLVIFIIAVFTFILKYNEIKEFWDLLTK